MTLPKEGPCIACGGSRDSNTGIIMHYRSGMSPHSHKLCSKCFNKVSKAADTIMKKRQKKTTGTVIVTADGNNWKNTGKKWKLIKDRKEEVEKAKEAI